MNALDNLRDILEQDREFFTVIRTEGRWDERLFFEFIEAFEGSAEIIVADGSAPTWFVRFLMWIPAAICREALSRNLEVLNADGRNSDDAQVIESGCYRVERAWLRIIDPDGQISSARLANWPDRKNSASS